MKKAVKLPKNPANDTLVARMHPPKWKNPQPAALYDLVVIGAGTAGIVAARRAAKFGAKVALVEKGLIGGTSVNVGCTPSKTMLRSARITADIRRAAHFGVEGNLDLPSFKADFGAVMDRVRRVRARVAGTESAELLSDQGVHVFFGAAHFVDDRTVGVGKLRLRFLKALLSTGARAGEPDIEGLASTGYLTNENVFNLEKLPKRLLVIGGGPLGCEFAQVFQRLGSQVTIVQNKPLFLPEEERDAAQLLSDSFADDGMQIRLNTRVLKVSRRSGEKVVKVKDQRGTSTIVVDEILVGAGRRPNVEGLGLAKAGVKLHPKGGVEVNDFLQTSNPRIYAAGDVTASFKFTHAADAEARMVVKNALFGGRDRFSSLVIPWCTYTDPEIAHVGLYVRDARAEGMSIKSYTIPMHQVERAVADGEEQGFVKIHVREGTDKILGGTIVASHAGEMINEITLAMVSGLGLKQLEKVIHSFPTQAEANRKAAHAFVRESLVAPPWSVLGHAWLWLQRRLG